MLLKILPVILLFFLGMGLRRFGLLDRRGADRLLRLVAYGGLPALVLASIGRMELGVELVLLPAAAALTIVVTFVGAWGIGTWLRLPRATLGVFVIGPSIMNLSVEYPFVLAAWGQEGFARFAFFDFGNAVLVLTFLYAMASWYGGHTSRLRDTLQRVITFPPMWALCLALGINLADLALPEALFNVLHGFGSWAVLLVMLALGVYFEPKLIRARLIYPPIALRVGLGLILGCAWVALLDLQGLDRAVVLFGAIAPVGFNTLVFASLARLDEEFAAGLVSVSLLLALLYLPITLFLLSRGGA